MFIFDILQGGYNPVEVLVILAGFALAVIIGISCHEFAHAYAALRAGDSSAKRAGRLTLNPTAHFEPMGLLCFLFAGIGWAKPVPVNPFNYRNFKRGNFWVSISGILTNIVIGFVCSFAFFMIDKFGDIENIFVFAAHWFFMLCMIINLSLAVFNLLPIPPLDGYNLLSSFTKPNNSFMKFMRENAIIVLLLVVFIVPMVTGMSLIFAVRELLMDTFLKFWGLFI